jgi:hypothetical protein
MFTEKEHAKDRNENNTQLIHWRHPGGITEFQGSEVAYPGGPGGKPR